MIVAALLSVLALQAAPESFAPTVMPAENVFQGGFSPDERLFYFFRKEGRGEDYRLYRMERLASGWTAPQRIESETSDLYPSVSTDGTRMVFASYRATPEGALTDHATGIWVLPLDSDGPAEWQADATPRDRYVSHLMHRSDGSLCYRSTSLDYQQVEFLCSDWNGRHYGTPKADAALEAMRTRLPEGVRMAGGTLAPSGRTMIIEVSTRDPVTNRPNADLWRSDLSGEGWTEPAPLPGSVNTAGMENFAVFSPSGDLYFGRGLSAYFRLTGFKN